MSIGKFASNLILTTNLTNTEILAKVHEQFPAAKTTMACIAWYKSNLRKKGLIAGRNEAQPTLEDKIKAAQELLASLQAQMQPAEEVEEAPM